MLQNYLKVFPTERLKESLHGKIYSKTRLKTVVILIPVIIPVEKLLEKLSVFLKKIKNENKQIFLETIFEQTSLKNYNNLMTGLLSVCLCVCVLITRDSGRTRSVRNLKFRVHVAIRYQFWAKLFVLGQVAVFRDFQHPLKSPYLQLNSLLL